MLSTKIARNHPPVLEQKKRDARVATLFAYRRIQLRLNRNEELHIKLDEKLLELQRVETKTPYRYPGGNGRFGVPYPETRMGGHEIGAVRSVDTILTWPYTVINS